MRRRNLDPQVVEAQHTREILRLADLLERETVAHRKADIRQRLQEAKDRWDAYAATVYEERLGRVQLHIDLPWATPAA